MSETQKDAKPFEVYLDGVMKLAFEEAKRIGRGLNALKTDEGVRKLVAYEFTEGSDATDTAAKIVELCGFYMLSPEESEIIRLDAQYPAVQEWYRAYDEAMKALVERHGIDHYFQSTNPDDPAVFKTFVPEYKTVKINQFEVKRTARPGERGSGSNLSKKEAEERGFRGFKIDTE